MNEDLILRARLMQAGHTDEDIVKFLGARRKKYGGMGAGRLPVVGKYFDQQQTGTSPKAQKQEIADIKRQRQEQNREKQRMNLAGQSVVTQTLGPQKPKDGADLRDKSAIQDTQKLMDSQGMNEQQPLMDNVQPAPNLDQMAANNQQTTPAANNQQPTSNVTNVAGGNQQSPPQPPQPPAQGGNVGVNPNVQNMAQQFQAGQDMQTIQQGKGAEKQTYMKNRSGLGKVADFLTFGATSQFGSTGGRARRKANQQSEQQTQNYQAAQGRMNQRAMGMSPVMTSFDNQLSAYDDFISLRKGIQERNTTTNLRR